MRETTKKLKEEKRKNILQDSFVYRKICPQIEPIYLKVLRQMGGEKRLKTAFELYEIAHNLCKSIILEQNPNITKKELKQLL